MAKPAPKKIRHSFANLGHGEVICRVCGLVIEHANAKSTAKLDICPGRERRTGTDRRAT